MKSRSHSKYRATKESSNSWSYIRRFLQSRVGRAWDAVYSEICAEADPRNYNGHHLREHLDYYITQNCFIQDGVVVNERGTPVGGWWREFYVHPVKKTLELAEKTRERWRPKKVHSVFELNGILYHKHEGIWYRVQFKPVEKIEKIGWGYYAVMPDGEVFVADKIMSYPRYANNYTAERILLDKYGPDKDGHTRYCCWKQAANHHEIEQLKKKYGEKLP